MLLARRAGGIALANLRSAADGAARLAATHREDTDVARTLDQQQALPTTFGALAAGWLLSLDDAATELDRALSALPAQYGGAAGTLAAVHPDGFAFADTVADLLGLARPVAPWHTARTPVTTLASALGVAAGSVAKPATDVVLMASTNSVR